MSKSARYILYAVVSLAAATLWFGPAWASGGDGGHGGLGEILFTLVIILLSAKLGGHLMERVGQPSVLGELLFGVIIGNIYLLGFDGFEALKGHEAVTVLAEIGVILLLFEVGLESTVSDMMKVGVSSLFVALLGIVAPFFLGWGVSAWLLPTESIFVHIFIGATLTATSVGITARVLKDMGRLQDKESRIVLGAAVIDDVLGLVILAVVSGIIKAADAGGEAVTTAGVLMIVAKAFIFLVGSIVLGGFLFPRILNMTLQLRGTGVLLTMALVFCFAMAWLAELAGLASIVGAFAAGLILEDVHVKKYRERGEHELEELIRPLAVFLTPIFFVDMGMSVDLRTFGDSSVLVFAAALTVAAIIGKQAAALGVTEKGLNRLAIGLGMIPRGEVGLIFAAIGASLYIKGDRVIDPSIYSAVVIMVIITTMVTPPVLKIAMEKKT